MNTTKLIILGIVGVVVIVLLMALWPIVAVPAGHRGVITLFGNVEPRILNPGLNVVNPMAHVHDLNVQIQRALVKGDAASRDLQHVSTALTVNFQLDPASVAQLYSNIGTDYEAKILDGTAQDSFKAITALYTAEELISKREEVRQKIRESMTSKVRALSSGAVHVDDVFITNFDFSPEFNKAIEAKQEAEQRAQKATRDLERIKIEASQRIAQSTAEAQAIKIQAEAINASGGASYVALQAINKWNGQLPYYTGGPMPFIQPNAAQQAPWK